MFREQMTLLMNVKVVYNIMHIKILNNAAIFQ